VKTPQTTIVDLGTEFGVAVDGDGESKVVVFRGEVELQTENRLLLVHAPTPGSVRLKAGEARRVSNGRVAPMPEPLVREKPFVRSAAALDTARPILGSIVNGSFEEPSILDLKKRGPGSPTNEGYESTVAEGWTLVNALAVSSVVLNNVHQASTATADGAQFLVLNARGHSGSASQTFETIADQEFEVTFAHNQFYGLPEPTRGDPPKTVELTATVVGSLRTLFAENFVYKRGERTAIFTTDPAPWPMRRFRFKSIGSSTTLTFTGNTSTYGNFGQVIDDVIVRMASDKGPVDFRPSDSP
jgi:hypothetical protein